jgi:hypothetical protein
MPSPAPPAPPSTKPAASTADEGPTPTWTYVDSRVASHMDRGQFMVMADARRAIWTAGFQGMVGGAGAGYLAYHAQRAWQAPAWLQGKHKLLYTLAGSALGSWLGASMAGQRVAPGVSDVWEEVGGGPGRR